MQKWKPWFISTFGQLNSAHYNNNKDWNNEAIIYTDIMITTG